LRTLLVAITAASLASSGCSVEEVVSPAPNDAGIVADAAPDAEADAESPLLPDAGSAKRTVMTRSPFGGPVANHLADGDFELSTSRGSGQYGSRAFSTGTSAGGEVDFAVETGGLCRSGLRCAIFAPKTALFLRGAAAPLGKGSLASFWAKVPAGKSCASVTALMVTCDTLASGHTVKATSAQPDAAGWCSYGSRLAPSPSALCLYIQNKLTSDERALVDSAVLGPDDGTVLPLDAEFFVPTAELTSELESVRETIRKTTIVGRPGERPTIDVDAIRP
jgi:hypothetical protein